MKEDIAMSQVINDVVKMNWEKSKWLQTKKGSFIVAGQTYTKADGTPVDVLFTVNEAFVWGEESDLWKAEEFITWFKSEHLITADEAVDAVISRLGLEAHVDDIKARLNDLSEYGVEQEYKLV